MAAIRFDLDSIVLVVGLTCFAICVFSMLINVLRTRHHYRLAIYPRATLGDIPLEQLSVLSDRAVGTAYDELSRFGFKPDAYYVVPDFGGPITEVLISFRNESLQVRAVLGVLLHVRSDADRVLHSSVLLNSRLPSNRDIETTNSNLTYDQRVPDRINLHFPSASVEELLQWHNAAVDCLSQGRRVFMPPTASFLTELDDELRHLCETMEENGHLQRSLDSTHFRLTWRGAVALTLRAMDPCKSLYLHRARKKSKRLLRELGIPTPLRAT